MKLKKVKIKFISQESRKNEILNALKGGVHSVEKDILYVSDYSVVAKLFSKSKLKLLSLIISSQPDSISELAKMLNKDYKNVYQDVKFLGALGIIELQTGELEKSPQKIIPLYSGFDLSLDDAA